MAGRFTDRDDPAQYLVDGEVLVVCPRCASCAVVRHHRLSCTACGYGKVADHFGDDAHLRAAGRCGRCGRKLEQTRQSRGAVPTTLPITCPGCKAVTRLPVSRTQTASIPQEPRYRGLDLWLQTPCRAEVLWALNEPHLDFLERYVGATLREREPNRNGSLASRLPAWLKAAKNRDDALSGLARLRTRLSDASR